MQLRLRQLPNLISSVRILLVVPIAWELGHLHMMATLWLFAAAAVSDVVDGFLAKHFGWQTELGGILDPVADKLMLATTFVVLAYLELLPVWLTAVVIARDVIIVTGAVSYRVLLGPVAARPSLVSKLNSLCQVLLILWVLGAREFSWSPLGVVVMGALVLVTTVVSGMDYVLVYGRRAAAEARARHHVAPRGSHPI